MRAEQSRTRLLRVGHDQERKDNGTIESELGAVRDYKTGQQITFPETEVDDWMILRPDGSEEGNFVGKFMDTLPR